MLKVFVTHGGLGSLQEAIYHKAVIVGIPFSNDQKPNILRAARHGYARGAILSNFNRLHSAEFSTELLVLQGVPLYYRSLRSLQLK